jgi:antitoxin VapB
VALSIKSEEADRPARELADVTGESITDAVTTALTPRLEVERLTRRHRRSGLLLAAEFQALPVLDPRPSHQIIGYGDNGLPT